MTEGGVDEAGVFHKISRIDDARLGAYGSIDRIIDHLKLRFIAEKPPPSRVFTEIALMAAEGSAEYF